MKVLFLTKYPYIGASSRYRVYQYIEPLKKLGVHCDTSSFMDDTLYKLTFTKGHHIKKTFLMLKASFKRLSILMKASKYDVVYMQREILPFGPLLLEKFLKNKGCKLVFDYDDALFIKRVNSYNPIAGFFKSEERFIKIFKESDMVLAGNDFLASYAKKYCTHSYTFEVAEDTNRIKGKNNISFKTDNIVIGWLGSKTTAKYISLIAPVLKSLASKYPNLTFEVMGSDSSFTIPGVELTLTPWSLDGELEALSRFDIGIMPLPLEDWSKGKSGGKARTYMAAGVVPVVTDIGYNKQLVKNGETGFLVKTEQQWLEKLILLIENPELRQAMSNSARDYVIKYFSVDGQAKVLKQHLGSLMEDHNVK